MKKFSGRQKVFDACNKILLEEQSRPTKQKVSAMTGLSNPNNIYKYMDEWYLDLANKLSTSDMPQAVADAARKIWGYALDGVEERIKSAKGEIEKPLIESNNKLLTVTSELEQLKNEVIEKNYLLNQMTEQINELMDEKTESQQTIVRLLAEKQEIEIKNEKLSTELRKTEEYQLLEIKRLNTSVAELRDENIKTRDDYYEMQIALKNKLRENEGKMLALNVEVQNQKSRYTDKINHLNDALEKCKLNNSSLSIQLDEINAENNRPWKRGRIRREQKLIKTLNNRK